jgi:hypothetical protein
MKMDAIGKIDLVMDALGELGPYEIVTLHNNLCEKEDRMDDMVFLMDEFDEEMEGREPWEVARACYYGNFRPCDTFFRFNTYGNIVSFDFVSSDDSGISLTAIAEYIVEHDDPLDNEEILNILEETKD